MIKDSGNFPRIVISGLSGDSGKTIVSCGLLACLKERGINITAFKKGPDYIDAAWLSLFSGRPARNLDTFMMGFPKVKSSFLRNACRDGVNVVEGNRGLFDGVDFKGTHSTAELAKLIQSPVIIVLNTSKVTRTAAASVLGCLNFDRDLKIEGVILNQTSGDRHKNIVKNAIEDSTGIPVVGAIPRLPNDFKLPSRHLGLITPEEFENRFLFIQKMKNVIEDYVDVNRINEKAQKAPVIENGNTDEIRLQNGVNQDKVKIAYFKDKTFSFYYPENLEMLENGGAEILPISSSVNSGLDDIDALYIGGGFPETNLDELVSNKKMMKEVKRLVEDGLPVYAECGGLIYLAKEIKWKEKKYDLTGVLPVSIQMEEKPQGHGYTEMLVDTKNPFYEKGTLIKGHEFHYSKISESNPLVKSCLSVSKGTGCFNKRDGLAYKNVFASYVHVHALAVPEWAEGMIKQAREFKKKKVGV
jgi:cobyrinic acid a,c-diamide synthase